MKLINKLATHKQFGEGSIVEHNDSYVLIKFPLGNKKFVFPDAFGTYLTLNDKKTAEEVRVIKEKREEEQERIDLENKRELDLQRKEEQQLLEQERLLKNLKIHPCAQAVFWVKEEDHDMVFTDWSVFTGETKSGVHAGQPNRPARLHQNSACLLTARDPGKAEKNRRILGAFMVHEEFVGKLCGDGIVSAHSKYKIQLSEEEAEKMLFWDYYRNEKSPSNMTWNTGKYRYFDNLWMAQILKDMISLKSDSKERKQVQEFFEHFCKMNQIKESEIPKPNGGLKV